MDGLSETDLEIRRRAREFVDTLIPYEVETELAGGVLRPELVKEHHEEALRRGLYATNMPTSVGGPGFTALQQVLVQEQVGPGDQRPRLVPAHARRSGGSRSPPRSSSSGGCGRPCAASGTSATPSPRSSPAATSARWRRPRAATATRTSSTA